MNVLASITKFIAGFELLSICPVFDIESPPRFVANCEGGFLSRHNGEEEKEEMNIGLS